MFGLGYMGLTWARYGKVSQRGPRDPLLDRFMPTYEIREVHQTRVVAPAEVTYDVARGLDLRRSGIVKAIFAGRELLMGSEPSERQGASGFLAEILALGWRVLADEPGRELILGAVTQPWKATVVFRGLPPDEFAHFNEPGYAKIVWNLAVERRGSESSIFRTETRVITTDPDSRSRLRLYWSVVSPGVLVIRREALRIVKRESELRARKA